MYIRHENIGYITYTYNFANIEIINNSETNCRILDNRKSNRLLINFPLTITINITDKCNFNCDFCYYPFKNKNRIIKYNTINKILKYINKNYIYEVDILGGEPLHDDVIKKTEYLIKRLISNRIVKKIYVNTNGANLNKLNNLNLLRDEKIMLSVSLQSNNTNINNKICKTDKTLQIKKNIGLLNKNNIKYTITTVISKQNEFYINKFCEYINKLEYCYGWVWHYPTITKLNKNFSKYVLELSSFFTLYKKISKISDNKINVDAPFTYIYKNSKKPETKLEKILTTCPAKYKKIEIMPNGDVYPCILLNDKNYYLGNIINNFIYKNIVNTKLICNSITCKFNDFCVGCPAYINNWSLDDRCPKFKK
jgi:radical SAM protein with 4Fe4S-binding SPASM domain